MTHRQKSVVLKSANDNARSDPNGFRKGNHVGAGEDADILQSPVLRSRDQGIGGKSVRLLLLVALAIGAFDEHLFRAVEQNVSGLVEETEPELVV